MSGGSTRTIRDVLSATGPGAAPSAGGAAGGERDVQRILERHGRLASQIIAILQDLQALRQYLPERDLRLISRELDVPLTRLFAIARARIPTTARKSEKVRLKPSKNSIIVRRGAPGRAKP